MKHWPLAVAWPCTLALSAFGSVTLLPYWAWPLAVLAFAFFARDAQVRYGEYLIVLRVLLGPNNATLRHADIFSTSLCRRLAFRAAALDAGFSNSAVTFAFRVHGVKWWHIMPKGFPMCLFKLRWWRTALGI